MKIVEADDGSAAVKGEGMGRGTPPGGVTVHDMLPPLLLPELLEEVDRGPAKLLWEEEGGAGVGVGAGCCDDEDDDVAAAGVEIGLRVGRTGAAPQGRITLPPKNW